MNTNKYDTTEIKADTYNEIQHHMSHYGPAQFTFQSNMIENYYKLHLLLYKQAAHHIS